MPTTVNGIGTHYWGKDHRHVHRNTCEHCHRYADLESYDTTKFFVVLFLPLIPLSKIRVLDQCPHCNRHRVMKLGDWQATRAESVEQALGTYKSDRQNPGKAIAAITACVQYQDAAAFRELARDVLQSQGERPEVLVPLADAWSYFGEEKEAETCLRQALARDDTRTIREKLAFSLLRQLQPAAAAGLLHHITSEAQEDKVGLLLLLVEGYQAIGNHREALRTLDAIAGAFPALRDEKEVRNARKLSERNQDRDKPIRSKTLGPPPGRAARPPAVGAGGARLVWAAVLSLIAAALGAWFYTSTFHADIYLVNGLDRTYTVTLDGEPHALTPGVATRVRVPQHRDLSMSCDDATILTESVRIDLPLLDALFRRATVVLNPDRIAVVVWEQVEYTSDDGEPAADGGYVYSVHAGQSAHEFVGVDYHFREFPDEISMSRGSSKARRERVYQELEATAFDVAMALAQSGVEDAPGTYLASYLRHHPDDPLAVRMAASFMTGDDFRTLAAPYLAARPLAMEWHRMYQESMERSGAGDEVEAEYRALLSAEPGNGDLMYLVSRTLDDRGASVRLLERAVGGSSPSSWAYHALAFQHLVEGRYGEALPLARKACAMQPANDTFEYTQTHVLYALHRYRELLEMIADKQSADPSGARLEEEVKLQLALGDRAAARRLIDEHLAGLEAEATDPSARDYVEGWSHYLEAVYQLGMGDLAAFEDEIRQLEEPRYAWQAALSSGSIAEAAALLHDDAEAWTPYDDLMVYVAAARAGETAIAGSVLAQALDRLAAGDAEERTLARCLSDGAGCDAALALPMIPDRKVIALAALYERHGDRRCRELAKKLNYGLHFEARYLARFL